MSLPLIAGFLVALGVLFVMMASMQRRSAKTGKRLVAVPPESVQILSLLCFIAGVTTLAYAFYTGQVR